MTAPHSDDFWMRLALTEAQKAEQLGEVPIGAVLILEDQLIAQAHNRSIAQRDPTAHAEIECLRQAGKILGNYRLNHSTLYVTIEPCAMCAGALIWARIERVVFAASDAKAGALGSVLDLSNLSQLNHQLVVSKGVLEPDCRQLIQNFFRSKR